MLNACLSWKYSMGIINDKANRYLIAAPVNDPKTAAAILVAMKVPPHMMATATSFICTSLF
jgi:hypothetical protein